MLILKSESENCLLFGCDNTNVITITNNNKTKRYVNQHVTSKNTTHDSDQFKSQHTFIVMLETSVLFFAALCHGSR